MPSSKKQLSGDSGLNIVAFNEAVPAPAKEKRAKAPRRKTTRATAPKPPKRVAAVKTAVATPVSAPTHEQIAVRAYFLAQKRAQAGISGSPTQDWLDAERELREELKANSNR